MWCACLPLSFHCVLIEANTVGVTTFPAVVTRTQLTIRSGTSWSLVRHTMCGATTISRKSSEISDRWNVLTISVYENDDNTSGQSPTCVSTQLLAMWNCVDMEKKQSPQSPLTRQNKFPILSTQIFSDKIRKTNGNLFPQTALATIIHHQV